MLILPYPDGFRVNLYQLRQRILQSPCNGRIRGGKNPLDSTSVHPESYEAAEKLLTKTGFTLEDVGHAKMNLHLHVNNHFNHDNYPI